MNMKVIMESPAKRMKNLLKGAGNEIEIDNEILS
jgi:hypothetical protein